MNGRRLVLASGSPRRKHLLSEAGIMTVVSVTHVDELTSHPGHPKHLAAENAFLKANFARQRFPDDVVLAADTIVVMDGQVFGKPASLDEAHQMLAALTGRIHEVITAVCITSKVPEHLLCFDEVTRVRFKDLTAGEIQAYLRSIDPLDKAGGYAAQDDQGRLISCIEGSISNVIGLPMERTLAALARHFPDLIPQNLTNQANLL